jgi:hypothetical protein
MAEIYNFVSNAVYYSVIFIIDFVIAALLLLKDEIILFSVFFFHLIIDWFVLIKSYLIIFAYNKKFEALNSFMREWHFQYY